MILPYHLAEERLTEESAVDRRPPGDDPARDRPLLSRQGRPGPRRPGRRPLPPGAVPRAPRPDRRLQEPAARRPCCPTSSRSTPDAVADEYLGYAEQLRPFVRDTTTWLHEALGRGKRLLFEGAQGSLLDVDHGSYPVRDQLQQQRGGDRGGLGRADPAHRPLDRRRQGVHHAGRRRARSRPSRTTTIGERIRRVGREYGTVTGRPRRCGWFDAVAVRYSARVSGSTEIAVMLLDVLSGLDELQGRRRLRGRTAGGSPSCPATLADLERCRPVYETAARLVGRPDRRPALVRPARDGPGLRRLPRRPDRRPGLDRLGRPGPPADDHRASQVRAR